MSIDETEPTPSYATLPGGISISDVSEAIAHSGYPLQADVAHVIKQAVDRSYNVTLNLQEEWTYVDGESDQVRSLDTYAAMNFVRRFDNLDRVELQDGDDPPSGHSHWMYGCGLDLLVECKQSEMPYVFFIRDESPSETHDFPEFVGIPSTSVILHHKEPETEALSDFAFHMSVHDIIGVSDFEFFKGPGKYAGSISNVVRRGKKVELTGEEAYRSLMLPLRKAAQHLKGIHEPEDAFSEDWFYRIHIVVCVAVLRAPMFASRRQDDEHRLEPIPWVRAWRLEPRTSEFRRDECRYMDVVHESFLPKYLEMMLRDFVALATRLEDAEDVLFEGRGVDELPLPEDTDDSEEGADERPPAEHIRALTAAEKAKLDAEQS
ncbi:hypothetical protein [Mycolicibacterium komossense]|uniref:Uncharacterized protein n=1 Tax=Mycolicibacterium komossense TaxID=1779 RepID=A0ABT3CI20_9MYCO|nr:hypothetical protein [Mycolicibacterium komossense]MCV7229091.1 hypothetical protein [Mycolicibacterium komossense]